jgi:hypothetical protein
MSDPYNTAPAQPHAVDQSRAATAPIARPGARAPRRTTKSTARPARGAFLPVLNVVAVIGIMVWAEIRRGGMSGSAFVVVCGPMLLAIAASIWDSNRTFTTVVRVLNVIVAATILFKLMRYASMGLSSANMLLMFVLSVGVPAVNAFWLKSKEAE